MQAEELRTYSPHQNKKFDGLRNSVLPPSGARHQVRLKIGRAEPLRNLRKRTHPDDFLKPTNKAVVAYEAYARVNLAPSNWALKARWVLQF